MGSPRQDAEIKERIEALKSIRDETRTGSTLSSLLKERARALSAMFAPDIEEDTTGDKQQATAGGSIDRLAVGLPIDKEKVNPLPPMSLILNSGRRRH